MTNPRASQYGCIAAALALSLPQSLPGQDGVAIEFARTGYRLTALGAKVSVTARVVDARRRAVPNAPIAYRTSDPSIATVTNQGVVQSKRVGRTRVWAVSGTDSASALIVVDQWATTFAFNPPKLSFDALGRQMALQVELRDAVGNAIPYQGRTAQCRVRDERIASINASGQVVSRANGLTWVRCTDKGVSDSVRVEVRQRAAKVQIAGKLAIGTKQVNDTFRLRAAAFGPANDSIANPRTTWASLVPGIVSIHPLSGAARAIGPGVTRIVTQVGDVTDTVTITVDGTPISSGEVVGDTATGPKQATLKLDLISPFIPDTVPITLAARDGTGGPIANAEREVRLSSSNERVVRVLPNSRRIIASDTGSAWLVAHLTIADGTELVDSMLLSPRTKLAVTTQASTSSNLPAVRFERPTFNVDSQRTFNREQLDKQLRAIIDSGSERQTTGRTIGLEGIAGHVQDETNTGAGLETRSGLVFGAIAQATPFRQLVVTGTYRTGTLVPLDAGAGEDMAITELEGELGWWVFPWFGLGAGYRYRLEATDLSKQFWTTPVGTVRLRGAFIGDAVRVTAGASMFPGASYTGRTDKPEIISFAGETGLDVSYRVFRLGIGYYVERFSFAALPGGGAPERFDVYSTLRARFGFSYGGGRAR